MEGITDYLAGTTESHHTFEKLIRQQLSCLIRLGSVSEVDYEKALARVNFGQLKTWWVPWLTAKAGADRVWNPPQVGEQVVVISPHGDFKQSIIIGALYKAAYSANGDSLETKVSQYADGSVITANTDDSEYSFSINGDGKFTLTVGSAKVEISEDKLEITCSGATIRMQGGNIYLN